MTEISKTEQQEYKNAYALAYRSEPSKGEASLDEVLKSENPREMYVSRIGTFQWVIANTGSGSNKNGKKNGNGNENGNEHGHDYSSSGNGKGNGFSSLFSDLPKDREATLTLSLSVPKAERPIPSTPSSSRPSTPSAHDLLSSGTSYLPATPPATPPVTPPVSPTATPPSPQFTPGLLTSHPPASNHPMNMLHVQSEHGIVYVPHLPVDISLGDFFFALSEEQKVKEAEMKKGTSKNENSSAKDADDEQRGKFEKYAKRGVITLADLKQILISDLNGASASSTYPEVHIQYALQQCGFKEDKQELNFDEFKMIYKVPRK